jgi:two-component system CheB/CheR fusion protein
VRWLEARGRVIRSDAGAPVRMAGVCADITARKLADYAIRESEERFRLMANAAPVLIWISGTDRSWTWLNRQWLEFVGRPIEQETGKGWSEHVHPDDLDRCLKRYTSSFNKRESFSMEFRLRRRDGEYRWVLNTGVPRYDSQGIFAGYIGSCLDITERKRSEQALRAADRRKDEFLAMLAHELRNPLAPIRNSLEILKRSEDDPGALRQGRDVIERQVSHLVRLVDDLIDVSRITRDKLELRKTRVELASILHQALDTCRPLAARENQVIELALPAQPIYLDADPVRLAQVFSNLLNNACKYTPPHGKISITAEVRDSEVTVSVKDTGIGIPPEKLNRIFEMFVQIDPSLEGASGGLGIGLTLAKRLVELHHGQISASSGGAGAGSMFTVRLPILLQTAQPSNHPGAGPPEAVVGVRILVVDDNQDSALSLAELLRLMGHEVHVVHDGLEAVKTADEFRPALALLDIGLPGMNGYEVCRSIRQQAWGREMVLVALTGWGQDEDQKKAMAAGFNHHLIKPPAFDVLSRLIGELSRRENRAFSDA